MAKICLLINAFYPYNPGETFLANELEYLNGFDRIILIPVFADAQGNRFDYGECRNSTVSVQIPAPFTGKSKMTSVLKSLLFGGLYQELACLARQRRLTLQRAAAAVRFAAHGVHLGESVLVQLKNITAEDEVVIYSYWMNHGGFVAAYIKDRLPTRKVKLIIRGHRIDIYEYANALQYIPMRSYIFDRADLLCPIAEDGRQYLQDRYAFPAEKIRVMRLGTADHGVHIPPKGDVLRLVSCSWMRKVKRIHLIVEALSKLDCAVEWTHYGDGEEFAHIQQMIQMLDRPNIRCVLKGAATNGQILEAYSQQAYHAFINVSESEGVPVSIMEAMSFGKLIIATDVGGSSEIVHDGANGYLLNMDCTAEDIADMLRKVHQLTETQYLGMCERSRSIWQEMCHAEKNYKAFAGMLTGL